MKAASLALIAVLALAIVGCATRRSATTADNALPSDGVTTTLDAQTTLHRFDNGLLLVHRRTTANDIVGVSLLSRPGSVADPEGKSGRANLMARLLTKGTKTRTSDEIASAIEGLGARLSASADHDYVSVSLQCVRDDFARSLEILADVTRHPSFPLAEIDTERKRVLADIRMKDDRPPSATMKHLRRELFDPHPYARALDGDPADIATLTQLDLATAHIEHFRPDLIVVGVVGDLPFETVRAALDARFGDWPDSGDPLAEARKTFGGPGRHIALERDIEQGFIALATHTAPEGHPDSPAVDVASAVLGQGMSSRLFTVLRDQQGLAYTVGAFVTRHFDAGFLAAYIGSSPASIKDDNAELRALATKTYGKSPLPDQLQVAKFDLISAKLWDEVDAIKREPVPEAELDRARAYIVGNYLRRHETNSQQAFYLAYCELAGLGVAYDRQYPQRVREVTSRDVLRVANKYFNDPTVVVTRPAWRAPATTP